jgi:hypothetical protein
MAQTWEEILQEARLSADESKLLDNIVKRVPEFKDGRMRQADYSRAQTELQKKQREYDEAIQLKGQVQEWWEEKKPIWQGLIDAGAIDEDSQPIWPKERERLKKELEDAKKAAVAGADVDPAELDKRIRDIVKSNGGVTQDELNALVKSEAAKLAAETFDSKYTEVKKEMNEKTIPFITGFSVEMNLAVQKYQKETGEEWTTDKTKEVFQYMTKENNFNPIDAVAKWSEPVVKEKKAEADRERWYQERKAKEDAERGDRTHSDTFLDQDFSGGPKKGAIAAMLEESKDGDDIESAVFAAGRRAAAELRAGK